MMSLGDWADQDHRPGRLRHAAGGLERHSERFRRHSLRQFYHSWINRTAAINHGGTDGLALLGNDPQLITLVQRRRFHPPVAHGHAHFWVVHHADVALGHARLGSERDGDGVLRFQKSLSVARFLELPLLLLQGGALLGQLADEPLVFCAKTSRNEKKQNARWNKHRSPPMTEGNRG